MDLLSPPTESTARLSFLCLVLTLSSVYSAGVIPNVGHHYPVHIGAEQHVVQGRIIATSAPGSMVPSNVMVEGQTDADTQTHLRVEVRESIYKRPHVYHPNIKVNTSDPGNPQFDHPIIKFDNNSLPYGMEFVIVHSNAFVVDEDRYIVVNDFSALAGETRVHFDVILKDKLAETKYVSNHLPFVVEIEYPVREKNPQVVLFAAVLIATIVAISLLIPFVVRAKRRSRAGKPICGCGSADDGSDSDSNGSAPDYVKHRAMSLGGKDNLAMILDNGRLMNHSEQTERPSVDPHTTIQNAMLRSTSNIHFQPHYLDPHYSDVYERPDFSHVQRPTFANPGAHQHPHNHNNLAFGKGASSARSSMSSNHGHYTYPANFNPQNGPSAQQNLTQSFGNPQAQQQPLFHPGNAQPGNPQQAPQSSIVYVNGSSPTALEVANSEAAKRLSPLAAAEGVKVVVTSASNQSLATAEGGVARKTSTSSHVFSPKSP